MNSRRARRPRTTSLHLAALAATSCLGSAAPISAHAQGPSAEETSTFQSAAARQPVAFSIPAGSLTDALHAFERATGIKLNIDIPQPALGAIDPLAGLPSAGLTGLYTPEAALERLLAGTGLTFKFADAAAANASIGVTAQDTIDVTTSLPNGVAMTKFTEPLLDTPQTIVAVPAFIVKEEAATTLRDTLRNVPGISLAAGEFGAQGDNLTIRGFTARNDIFLDGIRDFGSYYRDGFDYEQVDVLEGPAGVQFGRGATGGVINQESKVPETQHLLDIQTQFGTNATRRLSADFNQPMPQIPGGSAFRLNAMGVEGNVAERDKAEIRRYGVAPSLAFGMNTSTRTTFNYVHLVEDDTPDYGLPWFFNQLAPGVNRRSYFGFGSPANGSRNYLKTGDDIVTGKVEHDFGHGINVHSIARWASYRRNAQITEPQICSNASISVPVGGYVTALPASSVTGKPCAYTPQTDPSTILVNRNQLQVKSVEGDLWDQTEVTARFKIHGIQNNFAGGVEGGQEISNPVRSSFTYNKLNVAPAATLINPNEDQAFDGSKAYVSSITHTKSESVGLYFVDTLKLGRLFELSGGIRWDRFDTGFNLYAPAVPAGGAPVAAIAPIAQVVAKPTYRAALVYKPSSHGSVYFDYGTSFNPSAETLALSVSSSVLPPEENETFEGGAKWSFLNERLMLEGAVFRTTKDNARETDPTNSNNIVLAGNQLVSGTTMSVVGRLPQGMDLVAGYAYLASSVQYSKFFPTSVGYQLANVPKQTFNLFVTHRLPLRFNGGFGSNYVASRNASSTVPYMPLTFSSAQTFAAGSAPCSTTATTCYQVLSTGIKQVPGYWVMNAMLNHPVTEKMNFQVNVNNLTNTFYIDQPHPSHLVPGEGLNALVGVNFKF